MSETGRLACGHTGKSMDMPYTQYRTIQAYTTPNPVLVHVTESVSNTTALRKYDFELENTTYTNGKVSYGYEQTLNITTVNLRSRWHSR
ncbi:hypothetical protein BaRGS_00029668 [Batillaria attramentaria]|uniref:Uncharacterized protein n=1 Tax=Batillaria attramentaria TaxID=370345 RepID=A0ABD0JVI8_9CAEN